MLDDAGEKGVTEVWKPIPGYVGYYEASNIGRVRRSGATRLNPPGHIMFQNYGPRTGYRLVQLCRDNDPKTRTVHSVVAAAFLGLRPKGKQVNHIDGNKLNNRLDNLEYVTPSENNLHAIRLGLHKIQRGEDVGQAKLTRGVVSDIRRRVMRGEMQKDLAGEYGVARTTVNHIVKNRTWSHVRVAGFRVLNYRDPKCRLVKEAVCENAPA
jgi:hypothetical protein